MWYYLHTNGDLIYKPYEDPSDIRDSDFAVGLWKYRNDRGMMWSMLVEALSAGANRKRINDLAEKWGADNSDAIMYADWVGCTLVECDNGFFRATPLGYDSPFGFGETGLDALANLCNKLGYKPTKMWGATFEDLLCQLKK